nr:MAG TPA: hypothetical protein [Caudoviricetes sp.]
MVSLQGIKSWLNKNSLDLINPKPPLIDGEPLKLITLS